MLITKCCVHLNDNSRAVWLLMAYFLFQAFLYLLNFSSKDINIIIRKHNEAIFTLPKK